MARRKGKKEGRVISVDFTDVEAGGLVDEGEWLCEIEEAEVKTGDESGEDYIAFTGKTPKGKLWWNCSLQSKALFNLRGLLEACQIEVPDGPLDVDLDELVGYEFVATVDHEKYKGKMRARVNDYSSAEGHEEVEADGEEEEEEEGEEEEVGVDDDDDLPMISEEELGDMKAKQLQEVIDKYELDVDLKKHRSLRKKKAAVQEALEENEYLDD